MPRPAIIAVMIPRVLPSGVWVAAVKSGQGTVLSKPQVVHAVMTEGTNMTARPARPRPSRQQVGAAEGQGCQTQCQGHKYLLHCENSQIDESRQVEC